MEPGGASPLPNWLDLPRDLTIQIFIKVGVAGILCSVQGVCSSWRAIARDPRLYRVIDLRDCVTIDIHSFAKCCFCPPIKLYFWKSFKDNEFVNLATEAIDRSCGQAIEFSINADLLSFFDQFLYQLPYKTPGLKCFRLTEGWSVSDCCISKVFPKLPLLEEVEFCNCYFSKEVIEVVGRSCPKLKSFRMNNYRENSSPLEDEEDEEMRNDCALAIAENMNPSVRSLHLFGDSMNNTGLEAILDRFSQLEYLDLRQCVNIDLNGDLLKRCQAIERFRPPNDSTDDYSGKAFRVMALKKEKAPPPSKPAKSGGGKQKKKEAYGNEPSDSSEDDDEWVEADSPPKKKDDGTGKYHHCLQKQIYQQLRAEEIRRARGRGVQTTLETLQRDMKKDNEGANSSAETTSDGPEPNLTGKQATASANKTLGDAVTQEEYGNGPSDSSEDDDEWVEADSPSKKKGDGTREESSLSPKANLPTTMSRRNTKSSRKRSSKDSGDTSKRRKCTKKDNEGGNSSAEITRDGPEPNLTGKKATASANKTLGDAVTQGIMFERKVERLHAETNNLMMRVEEHYQEIMSFRENLNVIMADALQDTLRQLRSESWRLVDVEGIDSLRWEDQQKIRKYLESGVSSSNTTTESSSEYGIEVSQTSRATCKGCSQKIIKAEVRISTKPEGKGPRGQTWHHAKCFLDSAPSIQVEKLSGWESLSVSEQEAVNSLRKSNSAVKSNVVDELPKKSSTGRTKRKNDITSGQKSKIHKTEGNVPVGDGPVETSNQYLSKWFKSQKGQTPVRVLPPPSSPKASGSQVTNGKSNMKSENVEDLKVAITGAPKKTMENWKSKIENVGGVVHTKIKKDTSCLVISGGGLNDQDPEIKKARRMKLPIVREDYLVNCIEKKKMLPFDLYRVESVGDGSKSMITVKVKGRSAVHESSGLQDSGHILDYV